MRISVAATTSSYRLPFYAQFRTLWNGQRLGQLTLFRIIKGLAGSGPQPSSKAVLLGSFP